MQPSLLKSGFNDRLWQFEPCLFRVAVILFIIPLWLFSFIPSQDGPAHLLNAHLLDQLLLNGASPMLEGFYELNKSFTPTWAFHIVLTALGHVFGVETAERILLSIFIIFLPIVTRFGISKINRDMKPLAWLIFPMNYNHLFYYGFYSMCFSIPFFILNLALVLEFLKSGKTPMLFWIMTSGLLAYIMHIIAFGLLGISIALLCIGYAMDALKAGRDGLRNFLVKQCFPLFLCFVPIIGFMALFLGGKQSLFVPELQFNQLADRLLYLFMSATLFPIRLTGPLAVISIGTLFSFLLVALFLLLVRPKSLKGVIPKVMIAICVVFCVMLVFFPQMYLLTPCKNIIGGGFIGHRIALFIIPFFIFGLASWAESIQRFKKFFGIVLGFVVIVLCFHISIFFHFNLYLKQYLDFSLHIKPNSLILPLDFNCEDSIIINDGPAGVRLFWRLNPLMHASDHIARKTGSISLDNYEAALGYFPLVYKENMKPSRFDYIDAGFITQSSQKPKALQNMLSHYRKNQVPVNYILIWQMDEGCGLSELYKIIENNYNCVLKTEHGELFELREGTFH